MTHKTPSSRNLTVEALARVEGEGAMTVETADGRVTGVALRIYEPPRFFEALLRGRSHLEPPDITARICGICPVAYQMSACRAIEDACGVVVDGPLDDLRRLIYCGEWIESHTLHVYLLHAPDFLGVDGMVEMAERDKPTVERGLRLKKAGNEIVERIGGRAIHPINVRVGGFHRAPSRRELQALQDPLERARDDAIETVRWVAGFDFPDREIESALVSVSDPGHYPVIGGRVISTGGLDIAEQELLDHVEEIHVAHSTALHASLDGEEYVVGPLARFALGRDRLGPVATAEAAAAGLNAVERNPFRSIVVRAVEVLHACEEALRILDGYEEPDRPAVDVPPRAGVGHGCTEAPRGLLYHRYEIDEAGTILDARIIPPTSQNQRAIEHDLWHVVEDNLHLPDDELGWLAEQTIRNHDPCISCAAHFLDFRRIDR